MSRKSTPTPGSPLSHALFTVKLYPSTLFTLALPEKVTQVLLIRSNESMDWLCTLKLPAWSVYCRWPWSPPPSREPALSPKVAISRPVPSLPPPVMNALPALGAGTKFTSLWAEETMMSAVIACVTGSVNMTWIMFTVRALVCTPSPSKICSFRITAPPGIGIVVFGGGVTSTGALPLTLRPMRVEPSAVLLAADPSAVLLDIATTSWAATAPLRRFTRSTVALLCALAESDPIDPVVTTGNVSEPTRLGTLIFNNRSAAIPPSGQSTTWGVGPTVTPAVLAETLTETPYASPPTLFAGVFHAWAFSVVTPTSNPIAARLNMYCRIR